MVSHFLKNIIVFTLLASCQPQYTSEYKPQGSIENEHHMTWPIPHIYALSSTYLSYLAKIESVIYEEIWRYAQALEERLNVVLVYLHDYEESSGKVIAHITQDADSWYKAKETASHPIAGYRMVRRFATEFYSIRKHISQQLEKHLEERINKLSGLSTWPSVEDVGDAMEAILQIHYVYDINIEQFFSGNILGIGTEVGVTTAQAFEIAEYAVENEYYTLAMDWLKATESKLKEESDTISMSAFNLADTLKQNAEKHDRDFERNKNITYLYMFTQQLSENVNALKLRSVNYEKLKGFSLLEIPEAQHYNVLASCNGEKLQKPQYTATLTCWFDRRNSYFNLFPLKAELHNHQPLLIGFYDVVSKQWISEMKKAAMPTLKRRLRPMNSQAAVTPRIESDLKDEDIPLAPISARMELISGLNVLGINISSPLTIASYAFGGSISSHVDYLYRNLEVDPSFTLGNQVATFLVYLADVPVGGLTHFPDVGTFVKPTKGSALLWYTSMKNGQADLRMMHGGCPTVLGHKWTAFKRAHLNSNFLRRQCDLNSDV